jgi:hypothetical protein
VSGMYIQSTTRPAVNLQLYISKNGPKSQEYSLTYCMYSYVFVFFLEFSMKIFTWFFFHHQPISQAFVMDYTLGERAIAHHAGPVRIGGC